MSMRGTLTWTALVVAFAIGSGAWLLRQRPARAEVRVVDQPAGPVTEPAAVVEEEKQAARTPADPAALLVHPGPGAALVLAAGSAAPLMGVRIEESLGGGVWSELGETGDDGLLILEGEAARRLRAVIAGYAGAEFQSPKRGSTETVLLAREATIEGTVVMGNGDAPRGHPIHVLALDPSRAYSKDALRRVLDGVPGPPRSIADEEGHFIIEGLARGKRYHLIAGGAGLVCERPIGADSGERGVTLELDWLVGSVVRLRDADGNRPRAAVGLWSDRGGTKLGKSQGTHFDRDDILGALLAGKAELPQGEGWDRLLVFRSGGEALLESVKFSIEVPGYRYTGVHRVPLHPLGDGLPIHDLTLEPLAESWGEVEVRLVGEPISDALLADRPLGTVTLTGVGGEGGEYWFELPGEAWSTKRFLKAGVPAGEYDVKFRSASRLWGFPEDGVPLTIVVGGARSVFSVPMRATGSLEVEIIFRGDDFKGEVTMELWPAGEEFGHSVFGGWRRPPYVFDHLPLGQYRVQAYVPGSSHYEFSHPVDVKAGALAELRLEIPR